MGQTRLTIGDLCDIILIVQYYKMEAIYEHVRINAAINKSCLGK